MNAQKFKEKYDMDFQSMFWYCVIFSIININLGILLFGILGIMWFSND